MSAVSPAAGPQPVKIPSIYEYKVPARRHLLVGLGQSTAKYWANRIYQQDGVSDAVSFMSEHPLIDAIVSRYFALSVAGFKDRHGFEEKELVNNSKIAALMILRCQADSFADLFRIAKGLYSDERVRLIFSDFLYRLLLTTVQATPESIRSAVRDDHLRQMMERDIRLCLRRGYEVSEEWLSVVTLSYSAHYGTQTSGIA